MTAMEPADPVICICSGVLESTLLAARAAGASDISALRAATGANVTCGDCRYDLEDLLSDGISDSGS